MSRTCTIGSLALAAMMTAGGARGAPPPAPGTPVRWETSVSRAQARAGREGKPVFLLHLFGRLDEEFC